VYREIPNGLIENVISDTGSVWMRLSKGLLGADDKTRLRAIERVGYSWRSWKMKLLPQRSSYPLLKGPLVDLPGVLLVGLMEGEERDESLAGLANRRNLDRKVDTDRWGCVLSMVS